MHKPILILKTGSTYPELVGRYGDFDQWIIRGIPEEKWIYCEVANLGDVYPDPQEIGALILTGSHSMVTHPSPVERRLSTWLKWVIDENVPTLGICYGHQLIAQALGGRVGFLKGGPELGMVRIECQAAAESDSLFGIYPMHFEAFTTHWQTVLQLPKGAVCIARSERDRHQVVRYKDWVWGVQYHPEFSPVVAREYLLRQEETLAEYGGDLRHLLESLERSRPSDPLLERFSDLVIARSG